MKKFKIYASVLALSMAASYAYAATPATPGVGQGQVQFNGKLIDETCEIESGSENIQVTLPTLSTKTLAVEGATAGSKSFDIKVIKCPAAITKVAAHFEAIGSSGGNSATGNLVNSATTGAAGLVEVRLYNSNENQLILGNSGDPVAVKDQKATLRYYGGYYATGVTTPGLVTATALYTLSYP
ncbi:fimbrial protein [Erwinia sorbitola]|uniref:Fimbrial protein n=1 Tax=Erwinia sorbitola TaxID=2681984 RepID=A0A6I6EMJ8_9GAMM|nr:fimbrial protein [Erwinia sorbitola]MTD28142.1 fimbrial protein [Erwinia sorbitola]QGU85832.1 fimbrial protein [Erwinia sorbitola]